MQKVSDDRYLSLLAKDQYEREVRQLRQADLVTDEEKLTLLRRVVRRNSERSKQRPNQWFVSLGNSARDFLVELHQPVVLGIAYKIYYRTGGAMDVLDLVSEGNIGLLRLLDQGHPRDVSLDVFYTLASKYITGSMMNALMRSGRMTGRTYKMRRQSFTLTHARERLLSRFGHEPSYQELAQEMGITVREVCELAESRNLERPESIEALVEDYEGDDRDFVGLFERFVVTDQARQRERDEALHRAIDGALTDRQREVVRLRYGLDGPEHNYTEVARALGLSGGSLVAYHEERARGALRQVLETGEVPERKPVPEGCYNTVEAARVLGVSADRVLQLLQEKRLSGEYIKTSPFRKAGRWYLPKEVVDAYATARCAVRT